ncbi:hypothetical protein GCM10027592_19970 [Spirosoma flavus]
MKRYIFPLLFLLTLSAHAQEFKKFKVNLSLGYARPLSSGSTAGVLLSLEPKYGLSDNLDLGLRAELATIATAYDVNGRDGTVDVKAMGSYLLTGTYLFTTNNFRPYIGAGVGIYSLAGGTVVVTNGQANDNYVIVAESKFGGMLRVGFKAGHFNMGAEFNLIPNSTSTVLNTRINSQNNYLGVKVGFDIGGGRK